MHKAYKEALLMITQSATIDTQLLQGLETEAQQKSARHALSIGQSVYGTLYGLPFWINPDGSVTGSPKSPILANPEE